MIEVELPDGSVAEFPDGTPPDAIKKALSGYRPAAGTGTQPTAQQARQEPFRRASDAGPVGRALGAAGAGAGDAAIKTYLGVKQFFGGLSDEEKGVLREMKKEAEADPESGKRLAGEIAANIAMTAIPGSKAEKLLRGGAATTTALRAAGAAGLSGAAIEGLTAVGQGDTFAEQMASKARQAGVAGVTGGALAGTLQKMTRPFRPSAEATQLMNQGVTPTLQQGADSKTGRFIGGLTSGVVPTRQRQEREIARALVNRATEGTRQLDDATGRELMDTVQDYVGGEYDKVFSGKRFPFSPSVVSNAQQAAQQLNSRGQFMQEATDAGRLVGNVLGETGATNRNLNYRSLREGYLNPLSNIASGEKNREVQRRVLAARDVLLDQTRNARLTPEENARRAAVDVLNFDAERIRQATRGAAGDMEGVTLSKLADAYASRSMPGNTTREELIAPATRVIGRTPNQDMERGLLVAARRAAVPVLAAGGAASAGMATGPLGIGLGALYGLSLAGQTAKGARALFGNTDAQRLLAEQLRRAGVGALPGRLMEEEEE